MAGITGFAAREGGTGFAAREGGTGFAAREEGQGLQHRKEGRGLQKALSGVQAAADEGSRGRTRPQGCLEELELATKVLVVCVGVRGCQSVLGSRAPTCRENNI